MKSGHVARDCPLVRRCRVSGCERKHHTLLHRDNNRSAHQQEGGSTSSSGIGSTDEVNTARIICSLPTKGKVHLKIVPVTVWDVSMSRRYSKYCFLDQGSDTILRSTNLLRRLGVAEMEGNITINTVNGSKASLRYRLSLKFSKVIDLFLMLAVESLPYLSSNTPLQDVDRYSYLSGIVPPCVDLAKWSC